jgi:hypothetical protein
MKKIAVIALLGLSAVACHSDRQNYVGTWNGECGNGVKRVLKLDSDGNFQQQTKDPGMFGFLAKGHSGTYEANKKELVLTYLESDFPQLENRREYFQKITWTDENKMKYQNGTVECVATRLSP